ncbi:hypothetical protein GCM10023340_38320 [Nocardioides marinquilinus]|uniref:AAA domain-containing protein n=1 Tax=Nocardioides marinquilinus TaxID=1210400 RepID=A0ABP9Q1V4_9ACTN
MLIWVNGPFGVGKTAVAHELARRLDVERTGRAVVCDPEHVGFGLHRMMPPALRGDFQDLPAWRSGVVEVLDLVLREQTGPVVVPMTVLDPAYLDELVGGLRRRGHRVAHVSLLAQRETVVRRLRGRGLPGLRREGFALAQLDRALDVLATRPFATQVRTDGLGVSAVADEVARVGRLGMRPDTDGPARAWLRRTAVSLRHVRLD